MDNSMDKNSGSGRQRTITNHQEYENLKKLGKRFKKHTDWPPSFPDCYHLDYHIWNKINEIVYEDQFNQPFGNSKELEKEIKKVFPEVEHDLTEIRKALKQFTAWLKLVEEKKDSQQKWDSDKLLGFVLLSIIILFIFKLIRRYFMVLMWCHFIM